MALTWRHPFTCVISGPTGCGKTQFVYKLLKHADSVISPRPTKIIWCYGAYQNTFKDIKGVEFIEGLPELSIFDGKEPTLLVLDDLLSETDERVTKIFTKISHHANVSVLYLTQNLFHGNKQNRTITLNAHYMVLFKNPRDASQITNLAKQMYPGRTKFLVEAFNDATTKPFSYFLIDLKADTEENQRLRANVFPKEINYVYVPR